MTNDEMYFVLRNSLVESETSWQRLRNRSGQSGFVFVIRSIVGRLVTGKGIDE